jgi:hypothetical protein
MLLNMSSTEQYIDPTVYDANCDIAPDGYFLAHSSTDSDGVTTCVYGLECASTSEDGIFLWQDIEPGSYTDNMLVRDPIDGCVYQASDNIQNTQLTLSTGLRGEDSSFYTGLNNALQAPPSQTYSVGGFQDGNYFDLLWYKTNCPCLISGSGSAGVIPSFRRADHLDANLDTPTKIRDAAPITMGFDVTVSEDCSGFLFSIANIFAFESIAKAVEEGLITVTGITLTATNDLTGDVHTFEDGDDYDINYFLGETHANYITKTLVTGEYTFLYTITYTGPDGNSETISVSYCGKLICNCCLKKAAVTIAQADCSDCDDDYKQKFMKAFALSKALEFSNNTLTKAIMKKAIKERDKLVNRITKCRDC